ncbi:MAG: PIN domain-containing protein [Candidatus ainarchaeum sp.]|nr:PIN domain-containing protein [Candidatus ainarchaeum sp.]
MTENSEIKLVDSNILIYAYDKSDIHKQKAAMEIIESVWRKRLGALSIQNLAECYYGLTKKARMPLLPDNAKQAIIDLSQVFQILKYNEKTIINAINCQEIYKIHFWDALIVATMEENKIETIITENEKDFKKIKWIKTINPFKQ